MKTPQPKPLLTPKQVLERTVSSLNERLKDARREIIRLEAQCEALQSTLSNITSWRDAKAS